MCWLQLQALESLGVGESLVVGASAFHADLFLPSYEASLQLQAYPDVMCTITRCVRQRGCVPAVPYDHDLPA